MFTKSLTKYFQSLEGRFAKFPVNFDADTFFEGFRHHKDQLLLQQQCNKTLYNNLTQVERC